MTSRDRIIGWIIFQITFNLLQRTQTQEIIPHAGMQNLMNGYGGCVWVGESFLRNDKWQIKLSDFFSNLHSTFYEWLKLKK